MEEQHYLLAKRINIVTDLFWGCLVVICIMAYHAHSVNKDIEELRERIYRSELQVAEQKGAVDKVRQPLTVYLNPELTIHEGLPTFSK